MMGQTDGRTPDRYVDPDAGSINIGKSNLQYVDEALSGGAVGVAYSEDEPRSERYDEYQRDDDDNDDEADQTVTVTTTSAVAAARRRGTLRLQLDPLHTSTHTHTQFCQ